MRKEKEKQTQQPIADTVCVQEIPLEQNYLTENVICQFKEEYADMFSEHFMNKNVELTPRIVTEDGPVEIDMNSIAVRSKEMDQDLFNASSIYSVSRARSSVISIPTPFVTFGQKTESVFDMIDYIKANQSVPFQYNFANYVSKTMDDNAYVFLTTQIRHVIVGFVGEISDIYRKSVCAIHPDAVFTLNEHIDSMVHHMVMSIDRIINIGNPSSFDAEEVDRKSFDMIVADVLVPNLLATLFDIVDRITVSDMYSHAVSDLEDIQTIMQANPVDADKKYLETDVKYFLRNKVNADVRDLHAIFTTATFRVYKLLEYELLTVINNYRCQLNSVYASVARDQVVMDMYNAGREEIEKNAAEGSKNGKNFYMDSRQVKFNEF